MNKVKLLFRIFIFCILTVITQIGGLVYLLTLYIFRFLNDKVENKVVLAVLKLTSFIVLYLIATFIIVPPVASLFGRVPLPMFSSNHLKPLNRITCLLNRNYVKPDLKSAVLNASVKMNKKYPGTEVSYLDACFPFINKFPLIPHLSHNDGKKLDLAFFYIDKSSGQEGDESPSFIGYGICEEPRSGEVNTAEFCNDKGYLQYSFLKYIIPQNKKSDFKFDAERTRILVELLANEEAVSKIFIEPHLKQRLSLQSGKIRFHGCQAVRHDDHIHFQIK
ncbi:MAG: hypothetical protein J7604_26950 [Sporocytophaga sp.]|uniref:hypothetical protein n=1 Tax=Sporocytophaga sp. TaxID=2231183 RepID=UPI001B2429E0|nr:hypothetical protein [Sporocytophaga sp.]MBO9703875.1 hypothetical protein [Sporocytophaga sp.]